MKINKQISDSRLNLVSYTPAAFNICIVYK